MLSGSPRRDELTVKSLPRGNGNLHVLKNEKLTTRISRDTVIPSKRNNRINRVNVIYLKAVYKLIRF